MYLNAWRISYSRRKRQSMRQGKRNRPTENQRPSIKDQQKQRVARMQNIIASCDSRGVPPCSPLHLPGKTGEGPAILSRQRFDLPHAGFLLQPGGDRPRKSEGSDLQPLMPGPLQAAYHLTNVKMYGLPPFPRQRPLIRRGCR